MMEDLRPAYLRHGFADLLSAFPWLTQLVRFGFAGGLATAVTAGVYFVAASLVGIDPLLSNAIGYAIGISLGYVLHSRFSFRAHGSRDKTDRRVARFVFVCLLSFCHNSFWVWLLTTILALPPAAALVPMLLITPLGTFVLNRRWTFA